VKAAVAIPTQRRAAISTSRWRRSPAGARGRRRGRRGRRRARRGDRAAAERHGARYLRHDAPRGLNAARNTRAARHRRALVCFVDDDVAVRRVAAPRC
jgi:hypothetical protein